MARSDLIDLTLWEHRDSRTGYLVGDTEDSAGVWLDKDKVERGDRKHPTKPIYEYAIPEWYAEKKGLV